MTKNKTSVHLAIIDQFEIQFRGYHHQNHLWRMRAMGIIDSLSSLFLSIPIDEENKKEILAGLYRLNRSSNTSLGVFELQGNEKRPEVNSGAKRWEPIHDMIRYYGGDPYRTW